MLKEITMFIASLGLGPPWQRDINLFAGYIPVKNKLGDDTPERYLAVLENAGGAVLENVGGVVNAVPPSTAWPDYIEKAVQLLNRARTYFTARDDAVALYDRLHNTCGWELPVVGSGPRYLACTVDAYGPPMPIENPGEKGLFLFSTNYKWAIERAS